MNIDIQKLRHVNPEVVCIGSHPGVIQSILDFDFLQGRSRPSIRCIVATGRRSERYFFGDKEVLIPVYESIAGVPSEKATSLNLFINFTSGRRILASTREILDRLPKIIGGSIFAERVPERHALELATVAKAADIWIAGSASVGLLISGHLKLGAIGGVQPNQLEASRVLDVGKVAVISSSGGMVNEIIRTVALAGVGTSFAVAIGGERFPMTTPREAFLAAEHDTDTQAIAYFGELGGSDEYELANLVKTGAVTKPIIAYIAGVAADLFETPPQFGHAKAMAGSNKESAAMKRDILSQSGVQVVSSFGKLRPALETLGLVKVASKPLSGISVLANRTPSLITSSLSYDVDGEVRILGNDLLSFAQGHSFAFMTMSMLLGKSIKSQKTEVFVDFVLRLLVDHGPYVSGAMNTIVAARAGKDLVSSLAAGLLTVGPRFGGAINEAAVIWLKGVSEGYEPATLIEEFASQRKYISGIGHRKYRIDSPDPRVAAIKELLKGQSVTLFTDFALSVEAQTVQKKGNLILNVDGAIAACLLDLLYTEEGYTLPELNELAQAGIFNALFVLSRSVGFMAHYFDQLRLDEGLFRLSENQVLRADYTD
jgi:ATP citrate (pro-S)-lyase